MGCSFLSKETKCWQDLNPDTQTQCSRGSPLCKFIGLTFDSVGDTEERMALFSLNDTVFTLFERRLFYFLFFVLFCLYLPGESRTNVGVPGHYSPCVRFSATLSFHLPYFTDFREKKAPRKLKTRNILTFKNKNQR